MSTVPAAAGRRPVLAGSPRPARTLGEEQEVLLDRTTLAHGAATHTGYVRTSNEDSWLARPPVFAVADGMGGHDGGDVASRLVVEELAALAGDGGVAAAPAAGLPAGTPPGSREGARVLGACLARAQQRLVSYVAEQRDRGHRRFHAGTTAVCALVVDDGDGPHWLLANVGDSRAYGWHEDGWLEQLTVDHSVVQELVDQQRISAEEARRHPERHVVTRALGGAPVEPDFFQLPCRSAPRILLCSDGISGMMEDHEIARVVELAGEPAEVADRLVAAALDAGGEDNATTVVVDAPTATERRRGE